jgi:aromatic ring-opening dioxygenase LigB subunit
LLERAVHEEFDFASLGKFGDDELRSHAHWQFLERFLPGADIPVVLMFTNAIHYPAISPRRCYAVGEMLRRFIADRPANERVVIGASGGLSHFTAGYPWKRYRGSYGYGGISQAFDRSLLQRIDAGEGRALADLTSDDLMEHGDIEFRAWIALLGAVGSVRSRFTVYEPFYRAVGGMGIASWPAVS